MHALLMVLVCIRYGGDPLVYRFLAKISALRLLCGVLVKPGYIIVSLLFWYLFYCILNTLTSHIQAFDYGKAVFEPHEYIDIV